MSGSGLSRVNESHNLDSSKLMNGQQFELRAYLMKAYAKQTTNDEPFISFDLRDVNASRLTARMFSGEQLYSIGSNIYEYAKMPVTIKGRAGVFGNELAVYVDRLERYTGADFDSKLFLGVLERAPQMIETSNKLMTKYAGENFVFSTGLVSESFNSIAQGQVGGACQFIALCCNSLLGYAQTPGVEAEHFFRVAQKTLELYLEWNKAVDKIGFAPANWLLEKTRVYGQDLGEDFLKNIFAEIVLAITGRGEPEHLYAHIIVPIVLGTKHSLSLSYMYPAMHMNSSKQLEGGGLLLKY